MVEDHGGGLGTNRWLEAFWQPGARINALPGGLEMVDISGDGDARLIAADLGIYEGQSSKVQVYKDNDLVTEHIMVDPPCGLVGFYTENGEPRSAVLAVGAGSSVYIFKNMRPYFKYCLPHIDAHPKERDIWHKAGLDEELNVLTLSDELELLLKELGATFISSRTLKFLSLNVNLRRSFAEEYRRAPLVRSSALTAIGLIRKDSWNDPACSCLILGTENGEIFLLDPRTFCMMDKHRLDWPPVGFASTGLWTGDGRIMIIGRDGKIGAIRRGSPVKLWEKLSAPAVAITTLTSDGAAVIAMDGSLVGYSKKGVRLWRVHIPGEVLDLVSLPVPQSGLSLLAISTVRQGVRIYDGKHHVDTVNVVEPVTAMKYGRMGREERAMAIVTSNGGLCVKILKRTADFSTRKFSTDDHPMSSSPKFAIPKKSRLFVEQTIRERSEATKIHNTFQRGFLRLKLTVAKKAVELSYGQGEDGSRSNPVTIEANVLGLGPHYLIRIIVTNISDRLPDRGLFILCRSDNTNVEPRLMDVPLLPSGVPIPLTVEANLKSRLSGNVRIFLCKHTMTKPCAVTNVVLPAAENDLDI